MISLISHVSYKSYTLMQVSVEVLHRAGDRLTLVFKKLRSSIHSLKSSLCLACPIQSSICVKNAFGHRVWWLVLCNCWLALTAILYLIKIIYWGLLLLIVVWDMWQVSHAHSLIVSLIWVYLFNQHPISAQTFNHLWRVACFLPVDTFRHICFGYRHIQSNSINHVYLV